MVSKQGWSTSPKKSLGPLLCGALATASAMACSGPPPPTVTILPTYISYDRVNNDGTTTAVGFPVVDFNDPQGGPAFPYCPADNQTNTFCFDSAKSMSILAIPAGGEVTFGAFHYQPTGTNPTTGNVNPQLDTIQAMIDRITGTNGGREISLNEIQSRNSGGAFSSNTGQYSGVKARFILDWAGIDPVSPAYNPELPDGAYKLQIASAGHSLSAPIPGNAPIGGAYPNSTSYVGAGWDATKEKWYFPGAQTLDGDQVDDIVRLVQQHMNSAGLVEPWVFLEEEISGDIDGDSKYELARLHLWACLGGYMSTATPGVRAKVGLDQTKPVDGTWEWDVTPNTGSAYGFSVPGNFVHASPSGGTNKGIGYPTSETSASESFQIARRYPVPSEPAGYLVRSDMLLYWAYGKQLSSAQPHWRWQTFHRYLGFVDLTGADIERTSTTATTIRNNIASLRSQLRCIVGDDHASDPNLHGCTWDDSFDLSGLQTIFTDAALFSGATLDGRAIVRELGVPASAVTTTYFHSVPDPTAYTGAPPPGWNTWTFDYSGRFPQTTKGGSGEPGKGFVIARDTTPPRHAVLLAGSGVTVSGGAIQGGQTGRKLADSIGGNPMLKALVFDDNPGQVAFAALTGVPAYKNGTAYDVSAFSGLNLANMQPPYIQVWYSAQKAGFDYRQGDFLRGGIQSIDSGLIDLLAQGRADHLSGDSIMVPRPTFRFYPFRDSSAGASAPIQNYQPVGYHLIEKSGEPLGVVMEYDIPLADMVEPLGMNFAQGSEPLSPDFPGYEDLMTKIFVRAIDGRAPADTDYPAGNLAPFVPETAEHEIDPATGASYVNATQLFPNDADVPRTLDDATAMEPLPMPAGAGAEVTDVYDSLTNAAANFQFPAGSGTRPFDETKFGQALGVRIEDVVPPTVVLMVTDTKYNHTVFFGNAALGHMSQANLQQLMIEAADTSDSAADVAVVSPTVDASTDRAAAPVAPMTVAARLYPPENSGAGLDECAQPPETDSDQVDCLAKENSSRVWRFVHDRFGTDEDDWQRQLKLMKDNAFNPMNAWTRPTSALGTDCSTVDLTVDGSGYGCKFAEPPGYWVDEDTRLIIRVIAWDNLNSYLGNLDESTIGYPNIDIKGAPSLTMGSGGDNTLEIRMVDEASGVDSRLSSAGELQDSWPTVTFRNPNRFDTGAGFSDERNEESYLEVTYTDAAGNTTELKVNFYVAENTMRIRSLREDRNRSFD